MNKNLIRRLRDLFRKYPAAEIDEAYPLIRREFTERRTDLPPYKPYTGRYAERRNKVVERGLELNPVKGMNEAQREEQVASEFGYALNKDEPGARGVHNIFIGSSITPAPGLGSATPAASPTTISPSASTSTKK